MLILVIICLPYPGSRSTVVSIKYTVITNAAEVEREQVHLFLQCWYIARTDVGNLKELIFVLSLIASSMSSNLSWNASMSGQELMGSRFGFCQARSDWF